MAYSGAPRLRNGLAGTRTRRFFGSQNIMLLLSPGEGSHGLGQRIAARHPAGCAEGESAPLEKSGASIWPWRILRGAKTERRCGRPGASWRLAEAPAPRDLRPCCKAGRARSRCSVWRSAEKQAFVVARPRQGPAFLPRFQLVRLDDTGACVFGKLHRATPCDPESRSGTEAEAIDRKSSRSISILCISCPTVPPNILPVRRKCFTSKAQHLWLLSRSVWMLTWTLVCSWRWLRPKVSPSGGFLPVHMPRLTRQLASMAPCAKLTACRRRTTRKKE